MTEVTPPKGGGGRRRGLGRGLEALLGPADQGPGEADTSSERDGAALLQLDPALIDANPEQPRREFDPATLDALADSIRTHGLLHPIVVERTGSRFQLVAGERRLRAVRRAGLGRVAAIVRPAAESGRQALEVALVENLLRSDLSPIEEAAAYARLADTFGMSHQAIALRLGRSRPAVSNTIRLLGLPAPVQQAVADGRLSAGHARALLGLSEPRWQQRLAERIMGEGWTVRQTESAVAGTHPAAAPRGGAPRPAVPTAPLSPDDDALRRGMEDALGLPVEVQRRQRGARVVITCADDEDLDTLYARVGGPPL